MANIEALTLVVSAQNTLDRFYDEQGANAIEDLALQIWNADTWYKRKGEIDDNPTLHSRLGGEDGLGGPSVMPTGGCDLPVTSGDSREATMWDVLEWLGRARARLMLLREYEHADKILLYGRYICEPWCRGWAPEVFRYHLKRQLDR